VWECPNCGCKGITPDLTFCPQCYAPKIEPAEDTEASAAQAVPDSPQAPVPDGWGEPDA
jgi:hypothetical protein